MFYGTVVSGFLATFNVIYCLQFIWSKVAQQLVKKFKLKSEPVLPLPKIAEKEKTNNDYLRYNQKYLQSLEVSFLVKNQLNISMFQKLPYKHVNK